MVRRGQWEMMKNRLEKTRAVPKWEVGNSDGLHKSCVFIGEKET
jgi:hypothetical protein